MIAGSETGAIIAAALIIPDMDVLNNIDTPKYDARKAVEFFKKVD